MELSQTVAQNDTAFDAAAALLNSIAHFHSLSKDEFMELVRRKHPDISASLWAHEEFKGWICGIEGRKRLNELTTIAMERDEGARCSLSHRTIASAVEWQFCDRFIKKQHTVNPKNVDRMLKRAVSHALKKRVDRLVAIPCCVTDDEAPDAFQIAGIDFMRTPAFLSMSRSEGFRDEHGWLDSPVLKRSIDQNPWIAIAPVRGMDSVLGQERAQAAVRAALEFLAALMNPERGDRLVTAMASKPPEASLHFTRDSGKEWSIGWNMRGIQAIFGDGWYQYLQEDLRVFLEAGERAVARLLSPCLPRPLELRFLDALHWFGIASREASPASRIVASVVAIERLSMTRDIRDKDIIARAFSQRTVVLAQEFAGTDAIGWFQRIATLYDMRSRLVHGDISPADTLVSDNARFALVLARAALLGSLVVFGKLTNGLGTDRDLQNYFELMAPHDG